MARPLIMGSVVLVYMDGLLIARAYGHLLSVDRIAWGLATLLLVSLSIHYTNEYADYETDALTTSARYSDGSGVLPRGEVPRILALQAAWISLLLGLMVTVIGLIPSTINLAMALCLTVGAFFGWMYSRPPLQLAWRGWRTYTRSHAPCPTANAMMVLLLVQMIGWYANR